MEKLNMQTTNMVTENIKKIGELFPNCLTEALDDNGKLKIVIDFEKLKQELSEDAVGKEKERYQFTWPDKRHAIRLANVSTNDTLRPCRKESVDFDNTQNLYIEGDNLNVLKLLREDYFEGIKMIYIDPPYNTGGDFVYKDNFIKRNSDYKDVTGAYNEEGKQLVNDLEKNTESNGRFHTDWLNMLYPRLKVARNLLSYDGVIFISIDDNEVENLKKICNEIFGENNFVSDFVRKTKSMTGDEGTGVNIQHENLLCYARNKTSLFLIGAPKDFSSYSNPDNDASGDWTSADPSAKSGGDSTYFPIENPYTKKVDFPPKGRYWAFSKKTLQEYVRTGKIVFKRDYKETERGFIFKRYKNSLTSQYNAVNSLFASESCFMNSVGTKELVELLDGNYFSNPKPCLLVERIISYFKDKDATILDFFSGSATTAHAVMKLNAEDGGNRKFIMVQLPELTDEKSEAYKAGYKNICEIGKERIRRAGKKIKEEHPEAKDLDIGFRVLKLDSSNMNDVYYTPEQFEMKDLFEENIKQDRTEEDLLFQAMIELGVELSAKIEKRSIAGKTVWSVSDGYMMACFDTNVNESTITEIARLKPYYFVMRDSSLATDNVADNFEQIWQEYSSDTIRRIL